MRALASRKERDRTGLFFVEGIRAVAQAVQSGVEVERLVFAPDLVESDFARQTISDAERRGVPVVELSRGVFERLSRKEGPQGLALVGRQRWSSLEDIRLGPTAVWLALDSPQDPGNLGTILRTCDAAGVEGLILIGPSADPYDPTALRASTGAAFTIPLARASWTSFTAWRGREQASLVGATGASATPYRGFNYPHRLVLLMGSERQGLPPNYQSACDALVSIPMSGQVDSLNLAVAASVILYEIAGQRQSGRA